jgi:hypothetical protein
MMIDIRLYNFAMKFRTRKLWIAVIAAVMTLFARQIQRKRNCGQLCNRRRPARQADPEYADPPF